MMLKVSTEHTSPEVHGEVKTNVGKRLRLARLMARIKLSTAGKAIGKDADVFSKIERSDMPFPIYLRSSAATYFRCHAEWFTWPRLDYPNYNLSISIIKSVNDKNITINNLIKIANGDDFLINFGIDTGAPPWVDPFLVWNVLGPHADKKIFYRSEI